MIFYLKKIQLFLFAFFPILLIIGPFLADLSLVIIVIIFLYLILGEKDYSFFKNNYLIIFVVWNFYLIIGSIISDNPRLSLESSFFYFRFILFSLSISYLLQKNIKAIIYFKYILNFSIIFLIFDGYLQYFYKFDIFGFPMKGLRLSGPFGDEYRLGNHLAKMLPIYMALNFFYFKNNLRNIYFLIFILINASFIIILSGERLSFFYLIILIFSFIFLFNKKYIFKSYKNLLILFILLVASTIFISLYEPVQKRLIGFTIEQMNFDKSEIYFEENQNQFKITNYFKNVRIFSIEHQSFYENGLRIFLDNKMVGVGTKMFRQICNDPKYKLSVRHNQGITYDGCQTHPHNVYVQLLAETGIIGAIPIIIMFFYLTFILIKHLISKLIFKKIIYDNYTLCFIVSIFTILWPIAPSGNFFNNWNSMYIYLLFGYYLDSKYKLLNKF